MVPLEPTSGDPPADLMPEADPASIEVDRVRAQLEARMLGDRSQPARIGRFTVLQRLGAGAMGVVWAAHDGKLDRKIAIKLMRSDSAGAGLHEHLLREAQAMARLAHPNVGSVFEVGDHEGRTFVAMEFVDGQTLRAWVRASPRGWREVVAVYAQAGLGLAAAHAAGLVHRDFKPDNAMIDATGRVRVLDFGLARIDGAVPSDPSLDGESQPDDAMATPMTRRGVLIGTPGYMSPEQIRGEAVDARSDQFAYCVALWEALVGSRPFAGQTRAEVFAAVEAGQISAIARGLMPAFVEVALRRGLRPSCDQRHPSMAALLHELQDDPAARRRRRTIAAGLGTLGVIALGGLAMDRAATTAGCEARGAAIAEVWNAEVSEAMTAGMRASGIGFAESTIERVVPVIDAYTAAWRAAQTDTCLAQARHASPVDPRTAGCLEDAHAAVRELVGALREADFDAMQRAVPAARGLPRIDACTDAAALAKALPLPDDPAQRAAIGRVRQALSANRVVQLLGHFQQALAPAEAALADAESVGWGPLVGAAHHNRGMLALRLGDNALAERALEAGFDASARAGDDAMAGESAQQLVYVVGYLGARYAEAERWGRLADLMFDRAEAGDIAWANLAGNLGLLALHRRDYGAAEPQLARALEFAEREYGPRHFDVAGKLSNLGEARRGLGDTKGAREAYERAIEIYQDSFGADHPSLGFPLVGLSQCATTEGNFEAALAHARRAYEVRRDAMGPDHPMVLWALSGVGAAQMSNGDTDGAVSTLEQAVALARGRGGDGPDLAGLLNDLGWMQDAAGRRDEARAHLTEALAMKEAVFGDVHSELIPTLVNLGNLARNTGEPGVARGHFARALAIAEPLHGPDHLSLAPILIGLGFAHVDEGAIAVGMPMLERAVALRTAALGPDNPMVANALAHLVDAKLASGDAAGAIDPAERALAIFRAQHPAGHVQIVFSLAGLGRATHDVGQLDRARALFEEALPLAIAAHARGDLTATWLADVRYGLARVLRRAGDEPDRARALAAEAADAYRSAGREYARALADAEAFVRAG